MENEIKYKSTPKDVFLHFFNILVFYISVIALIRLYVVYINALFPDPLNFYFTAIANDVRWATSILIIAVPVFLLTSWVIAKDYFAKPKMREFSLRKWLVYLTLFVSAVTIIVDLIMFVNNFLSGELSVRFFLKVLAVLIIAGFVFWYYIWDLKRTELESKTPKILAWIVSAAVLASIITGFLIIGTPADQRDRKFDDQRISDLQILQSEILNYWSKKELLPETLSVLEDSISGYSVPADPQSNALYEYRAVDKHSFELCAVFNGSSEDFGSKANIVKPFPSTDSFQQNWNHKSERTCFTRIIDPQLHKDNQKIPLYD